MKKLILALAAMLIATPAVAGPSEIELRELDLMYFEGSTKDKVETSCNHFFNPTSFDERKAGEACASAVLHWLAYTGRFEMSPKTIGDPRNRLNAICGAQIILRYNDDTSIADALAAEFDTACGESPAIM